MLMGSLLLGVLLGALAGLLGTGGGTFAIPALVLTLGYGQKLAQGTALVMVVVNVLKGLVKYRDRSGLDMRFAVLLAVCGSVSAAISSQWALSLPGELLQKLYGVFLFLLAGFMLAVKGRTATERPLGWGWAAVPGLVGGVSLGMFGVGGAMLAVPLLVIFHGQSQLRAQGLGLALALPGCAITLAQYAARDLVDWPTGLVMAAGGLLGVTHGVNLAHRLEDRMLTRIFCAFLGCAGVTMLA